jgi:predicted hydrocarbon binding protein
MAVMSAKTIVLVKEQANPREELSYPYEREVVISGKEAFVVWHGAAKVAGQDFEETLEETVETLDVDRLAEELRETYSRFGWGRIEVRTHNVHKNEVTMIMRDSPLVGGAKSKGPVCWHVRASIEVIVSNILAVQATAFEVACETANRKYCEFKVSWVLPQPSIIESPGRRGLRGFFTTANTLIR